jgi:Fructosamine kinase
VIPEAAARAIGAPLAGARRVAGGDINDAWLVELADGRRAFVKSRADALPGEYATEAAGLRWLGEVDGGLAVPAVLAVVDGARPHDGGGRAALTAISAVNAGRTSRNRTRPAFPRTGSDHVGASRALGSRRRGRLRAE